MRILFSSLEEYIIAMICVTGELNYGQFLSSQLIKSDDNKNGLYTESYIRKSVLKLCDEKIIRRYKAEDGNTYLRLCYPEGEKRAYEFSPELFYHYELIAGKGTATRIAPDGTRTLIHGNRFSGNLKKEQRRQQTSQIIFKLHECEIKNDGFQFRYFEKEDKFSAPTRNAFDSSENSLIKSETIFGSDGSLLPSKRFMPRLDWSSANFVINRALVNNEDKSQQRKAGLSKTHGLLFSKHKTIMVYYMGPQFSWYPNCEKNMKGEYKTLIPFYSLTEDPQGIFFIADIHELPDRMKIKRNKASADINKKSLCNPLQAYDNGAYILPMNENIEPIIDILLSEEGEPGLDKEFFLSDELVMFKGNDITARHTADSNIKTVYYNLALLNYERLLNAKRRFEESKNIAVTVLSWQREAVMKYLGMTEEQNSAQVVEIDDELIAYAERISGKEYFI